VGNLTLGLIVGNRGFFPDHLCDAGRWTMIDVLQGAGVDVVALGPADTKFGSVESLDDATKCATLFKEKRDSIAGVVVALPNFGDERAIANVLRWADLNVPVLVQAFPDAAGKMTIADRRDAFCGKMSACNNLTQYGIPFSLTRSHTSDPTGAEFTDDLSDFAAQGSGPSARARRRSTLSATAKSSSSAAGSASKHSISRSSSAARRSSRRTTRRSKRRSRRSPATSRQRAFLPNRWSRWRASAS